MSREVVITGIGITCPLGLSRDTVWEVARKGHSGIISPADAGLVIGDYPVAGVGVVPTYEPELEKILDPRSIRRNERFIHLSILAAHEALSQAALIGSRAESNSDILGHAGVFMGVGFGGLAAIEEAVHTVDQKGLARVSPLMIPRLINSQAAGMISMTWGLMGPVLTVSSACASGTDAIGQAYLSISRGDVDVMLAGGAESVVTPLALAAFGNMRALAPYSKTPQSASRPFDQLRSGFVMAEGAAVLVLESRDHAEKRGAQIIASLVGYGNSGDAYHPTSIEPTGAGARRAISQALASAGITGERIGHVNLHGTSTEMNDSIEALVTGDIYGRRETLLLAATKSMTGHMLGGTGAVEAALTALSLFHQEVLPTINLENPDSQCAGLSFVSNRAQPHSFNYATSHSFGFGGSNAVLVLKR